VYSPLIALNTEAHAVWWIHVPVEREQQLGVPAMKPTEQNTSGTGTKDTGGSWQLRLVLIVIAIGVLAIIAKAVGLF